MHDRATPDVTAAHRRAAEVRSLTVDWADAIESGCYVSTSRADLEVLLGDLAGQIADVLAGRAEIGTASAVGEVLVAAHVTDPAALRRSIEVIDGHAAARHGDPRLLVAAIGALSSGYARALQSRTRVEQERISSAAFSARSAAEAARWASEARFAAVFAHAAIGISVSDISGTVIEVNLALCRMLGYTPAEITGRSVFTFMHPDDGPDSWSQVGDMMAGIVDHLRLEKAYYRKDGTHIWTELVVSLIRNPDSTPIYLVAMVEDVTERHELQARLQYQADHDPLTGLRNRTVVFRHLTDSLHGPAPDPHRTGADHLGVCYLDLDGFKRINDTLGHDTGDELLRILSSRLQESLGAAGHVVARMGGDEFAVLVERCTGVDDLVPVAREALDAVRAPVHLGGRPIVITASAGVVARRRSGCGLPDDRCRCAAELMKAADTTMYWAKRGGGDQFALFDPRRHGNDVHLFELSAKMPAALARGEFELDYQPLVRLSDDRVVGVEALVRWQPPDGHRLGPDVFIPLAEQTGLIVPLGRHVLREACLQARTWHDGGQDPGFALSVNIAGRQMRQPDVVEQIGAALQETGWPASSLQLELTESDLMSASGAPLEALHALSDMGVRIAIDDFGTGYSNLAYLHRLPVHVIKLAGCFVAGPGPAVHSPVVVAAIIELAHTLGLSVIAESVETAEQARWLRGLGCDVGQGWYFARPAPAGTVPAMLGGAAGRPG